jgi:hypothetical protein
VQPQYPEMSDFRQNFNPDPDEDKSDQEELKVSDPELEQSYRL